MSLALDDLPRNPDGLLQRLRQMAEVIARQNAGLISLQAERDTACSERDAAQAEIEKLRLLIRQLQRARVGRAPRRRRGAPPRPPHPPPPPPFRPPMTPQDPPAPSAEAAQEAASRS